MSGLELDIDFNFDPTTWCKDISNIDVDKRPIRKLICVAIELLDMLTPVARFIELLTGIIRDFLLDSHSFTEMLIILGPVIPIGIMVGYFFDTL